MHANDKTTFEATGAVVAEQHQALLLKSTGVWIQQFHSLDLRGDVWKCDCRLLSLERWLESERVSYHTEVRSPRNSERSVPPCYQQSSDPWCWQAVQQSAEPCSIKTNPLRQWLTGHQTNLPSWWQIPHSEKGEQERDTAYDQAYRERKCSEGNIIPEPASRGSLVSLEMKPQLHQLLDVLTQSDKLPRMKERSMMHALTARWSFSISLLWQSLPVLCT